MDVFEGLKDTDQVIVALLGEQVKWLCSALSELRDDRGDAIFPADKMAEIITDQLEQSVASLLEAKE